MNRIILPILSLALLAASPGLVRAAADLSVAPRQMVHTQDIRSGSSEFTIDVKGRTPPVNLGLTFEGPAENIRLHNAGSLDFSSIDALAKSIVKPGMTDEEKVRAIFYFAVTNLYDRGGNGCDDPLEYVSLWGFSWCGNFALLLNALWQSQGFPAVFLNPVLGMPSGHTISAVFYDNQWHMYDARLRGYFLGRDNRTVASLVELDKDDDLIRRGLDYDGHFNHHWDYPLIMHNYMNAASDWYDGFNAHYNNQKLFNSRCPSWDNSVSLHYGETLDLSWNKAGKWWSRKDLSPQWIREHSEGREAMTLEPLIYANGTLTCRIEPAHVNEQPVELSGMQASGGRFTPVSSGKPGSLTYDLHTPYFIPGLAIQGRAQSSGGWLGVEMSVDRGASWIPLWQSATAGEQVLEIRTDEIQRVTWYSEHKYGCLVRFTAEGGGSFSGLSLTADLFYRPMILPALHEGTNRITWTDGSPGKNTRKAMFRWLEDNNITFSADDPAEGDEVTITAHIANHGDTPAENVRVRFYDGDPSDGGKQIGEDVFVESVAPGRSAQANIHWHAMQFQTDAGTGISIGSGVARSGYLHNTIFVQADPENEIAEADEADNSTYRPLVVYNKAELILKDPSFVTFSRDGDQVTISALVRNQNLYGHITRAREARNVRVRFYDGQPTYGRMDRNMIGETIIPSIAPGEFGAARITWDVTGLTGGHLIYVAVDPLDEIPERWQNRESYMLVKKEINLSMTESDK